MADELAVVVLVRNSILAEVTGACLHNHENNALAGVTATYTSLFGCEGGDATHALLSTGMVTADPQLAVTGFAVAPTSPCVDAADPAADFASEPLPNGCRANMGAFGGTGSATSAGGTSCP